MDIYRDVGGFPVWFGLRSCFFCMTFCFWLHQAWPSRRTVVVFRWASKGYDENCHLQVWRCWISAVERWNDYYTSGLSYPKWRHWRCGGWSRRWVWCPNEWGHGCKFPSKGVWALPGRWGEEFGHSGGTQNTAVAPPHWKQPLKVVQVSEDDASLMPPGWDVSGMSTRKEDTLERFCLLTGLGTPRCPCRRSWMDRCLPSPLKTVICYTGQLANHLGLRLPPPLMRSGEMWLSNSWPPRHWEFIVAYILQRVDILKSNWLLWVKIILSFSNNPVE